MEAFPPISPVELGPRKAQPLDLTRRYQAKMEIRDLPYGFWGQYGVVMSQVDQSSGRRAAFLDQGAEFRALDNSPVEVPGGRVSGPPRAV